MGNPGLSGADPSVPKLGGGGVSCFCACKSNMSWDHSSVSTKHRARIWDLRKHEVSTPPSGICPRKSKAGCDAATILWSTGVTSSQVPWGACGTRAASSHMLGTKELSDAPHEALFLNYSHFLNKGYQVIHTFYRAVLFV